ncbi:MAG: hypothetical protein NC548_43200, partial [Lachnospiraceae bacterium]|nr:hypothetical protein [Lachnospiraceae bacterium]
MTADENAAGLEVSTDDSEDNSGIVSDEEPAVLTDTDEQSGTIGEDTEEELKEGGSTPEDGNGFEISEPPVVNPDKATGDEHQISFDAKSEQVELASDNAASFTEADTPAPYTFKVTAKEGYEIVSITAYKDSGKKVEGDTTTWEDGAAVATWTAAEDDTDTITYDATAKTYSIPQDSLVGTKDGGSAPESFTIVVTAEKIQYDVTVSLADGETANVTAFTYGIDDAAVTTAGTFGEAIPVPYGSTLKIKLTLADKRAAVVKVGNSDTAETADTEGVYSFANITAATAITVSTTEIEDTREEYAVETDVKEGDADSTKATITYTDDCVTDGKIKQNTDLTFKVAAEKGYGVTVAYKLGNAAASTPVTAVGDVYTISADSITFAKDTAEADKKITILVTVAKKEYKVTFNTDGATGAEVKVVKDNASTTPAVGGETLSYGDTLTFTVNPGKTGEAANKLRYVNTVNSAEGAMTAKSVDEGVYTYEYTVGDTTVENTTIYISATPAGNVTLFFDGDEIDGTSQVTISKVTGDGKDTPYALEKVTTASVTAKEDTTVLLVVEPTAESKYQVKSVRLEDSEEAAATKSITIGTGENAKNYTAYQIDLTDITGNKTVVIELELDDAKANIVTFTVSGNDVGDAFTAKMAGDDDEKEYHAGDRFKTAQEAITFSIMANAGYELHSIVATWTDKADKPQSQTLNVSDDDDPEDDWSTYDLAFDQATNKRDVTIKVDASVKKFTGHATVGFNKVSEGIHSYDVELPADGSITLHSGNIYNLNRGAQLVEFTVNALEDYTPVVSYTHEVWDDWGESKEETITLKTPAQGTAKPIGTGKNKVTVYPYTYSVPASVFAASSDGNIITLNAEVATRTLEIYYNDSDIEPLKVTPVIEPDENDENFESEIYNKDGEFLGERYRVPVNSDVTIAFKPYANCEVTTDTSYTVGTGTATKITAKDLKAGAFKIAKGKDNARVDIKTNTNYAVEVYSVTAEGSLGGSLELVKGAYNVDYTGQYRIIAQKGTARTPITKVDVTQSKETDAAEKAKIAVLSQDKMVVDVKISAKDENQTVKVDLTFGEGANEKKETVTFKVLPVIKTLKITGINLKDGKADLDQDADSVQTFPVKLTPATANMSKLAVKVYPAEKEDLTTVKPEEITAARAIADATLDNGVLKITTKPQKAADIANLGKVLVQIVDENLTSADKDYVKAAITVTVKAPQALLDTTPVVSVKSSTDTTITLTLGLDKKSKVVKPVEGELWYRVVVAADGENKDGKENDIFNAVGTYFIQKTDSTSQDAALKVSNANVGQGKEWNYTVKSVELVQFKQKLSETTLTGETINDSELASELLLSAVSQKVADDVITQASDAQAFVSKASAAFAANTRTPYYETKLKLKKGKTTVYTGQQDVPIATIQFNNDTTYKTAEVEDLNSFIYSKGGTSTDLVKEMVHFSVKDNTVYMSVDGYHDNYGYSALITGTHTIRVKAKVPGGTYPVSADIKVTVVRGINKIDVVPASTVVYKADNKAATIKVTPVYNNDSTGKNKTAQPKTKKLTYELVDASGDDYTDPYVKINAKNGAVTIDKKFVLTKENSTFAVRAKAADFEGNTTVSDYEDALITISDKALAIGRVELLYVAYSGYVSDGEMYSGR